MLCTGKSGRYRTESQLPGATVLLPDSTERTNEYTSAALFHAIPAPPGDVGIDLKR